ncbi:hypothetical protein [Streptomyces azureus]|uniref:Secreted protein n=1 Tax=Streptomyces azureus TaxID=146537 RepID=A0A0K8PR39_STRAJ|nr:hypothetical protein [Streptomyces azureus]GAP50337.1 secreted protein [Streptomyces azureus]
MWAVGGDVGQRSCSLPLLTALALLVSSCGAAGPDATRPAGTDDLFTAWETLTHTDNPGR